MAIAITDLTTLDQPTVQAALTTIAQQLQEANPALDLRRGVIYDLIATLNAMLSTAEAGTIQRYLSARSLLDIENDPTLADPGVVDAVLSNWLLTRQTGESATGEVTVVLSSPVPVTIGVGTVFTANGLTFTADASYTAKSSPELLFAPDDVLMTELSDGNWAFTIQVTATAVGTAYMVKQNTLIVPASLPTAYVTSYVTSDFTDGVDLETNTALLARLQQGIAAQAPSNRTNMQAMLRGNSSFVNVVRSSIVGIGDSEMIRSQHSIFPASIGNCVDWYVRTQAGVQQVALTKAATLLTVNLDGTSVWQVALGRDDAPGFYEVASILLPTASNTLGTFDIISDVRGLDLTGTGFIPDIQTVAEGAYSRYQTGVFQFVDTVTPTAGLVVGQTQNYVLTVRMLPQIAAVQAFISSFNTRSYGADILIKAPVPCFVQLAFTISKQNTQADPDTVAIATALAASVNNTDFTGRLYASQLQDVIHGYLGGDTNVNEIDMFGRIRDSNGNTKYVRDDNVLNVDGISSDPMTSDRTVQFFLNPQDVSIAISTDIPVPV